MTDVDRAALRDQLMEHEGLRLRVYRDSVGIETIGVGRNLRDRGITREEAMLLLDHDIDECVADLESFAWFNRLDSVRRLAVIDLRFNIGPTRFRGFRRMLDALERDDYRGAAAEMGASHWATQVGRRAVRLIQQMRTGTTT